MLLLRWLVGAYNNNCSSQAQSERRYYIGSLWQSTIGGLLNSLFQLHSSGTKKCMRSALSLFLSSSARLRRVFCGRAAPSTPIAAFATLRADIFLRSADPAWLYLFCNLISTKWIYSRSHISNCINILNHDRKQKLWADVYCLFSHFYFLPFAVHMWRGWWVMTNSSSNIIWNVFFKWQIHQQTAQRDCDVILTSTRSARPPIRKIHR